MTYCFNTYISLTKSYTNISSHLAIYCMKLYIVYILYTDCIQFSINDYHILDMLVIYRLWATMVCTSCFCFSYVGILGTHHHPETYHQHDALRDEPDWGLCQMDAVRDKYVRT